MITDTFKNTIAFHLAHMHKNAEGQDNKAGGLEFPMYALTVKHLSTFPVHNVIARIEWGLLRI